MPFIIDDIAEVITIVTVFSLSAVLSYPPSCVVVVQMPVAAGRCCCFTSGSFFLIMLSVPTRGLAPMISSCWGRCDDVARYLNPLLGQGD
jgi:hypothetical protein